MYRIFFITIACYLLVRFIFGFVIPVVSTMLNVRKKMHEMQSNAGEERGSQFSSQKETTRATTKPPKSDYIDFEEIK